MAQSTCRPAEKPRERGSAAPPDTAQRDESARDSRVPDAAKQAGRYLIQRDRSRWILLR